ncbi:MAG TPA: hypothetical protein VMZ11_09895 [Mycobacteriales bacterium]|nr:hypothetical protein [Mycobacteriales bacterium]
MISRLAGAGCVMLAVLAVASAFGVARSPDSDLKVGFIVTLPFAALALVLGLLAFWTRRSQDHSK